MNSRSSVNETNLVNFSTDLSTLNQLDAKDGLLSFPFDHIYACSDTSDRTQTLQLDKEVEISTHCVVAEDNKLVTNASPEINRLTEQLATTENQNKKLKDLLIYHLDLIQQQNELITKRDKTFQALKEENDTLKTKLNRRLTAAGQRFSGNPPPLVHIPPAGLPPPSQVFPPVTSTVVKSEPSQIMLNSFTELLLPDNQAKSYIFDSNLNKQKSFGQDSFKVSRHKEENFKMIENKRSYVKKEIKTEPRSSALYTVTSNSGNPVIQRIHRNRRRTSSGIGSLSRMPKSTPKVEIPETSKIFDDDKSFTSNFSVNKKSKMINTYGKSRTALPKRSQFGSLSDRLQLIDTTPTGEDPYQLGEADMREQSPIPKLMLQKTNHGRMKICSDGTTETTTSRRIYDPAGFESKPKIDTKSTNKTKFDRFNTPSTYTHLSEIKKEPKTLMVQEPDLDLVKTEPTIDWRIFEQPKAGTETSLCDFSYGENPSNLASNILPSLESVDMQDLFAPDGTLSLDNLNTSDFNLSLEKRPEKPKKRVQSSSYVGANLLGDEPLENKRVSDSKRGRKRAFSATTSLVKTMKSLNPQKAATIGPKPNVPKGKAACRAKKLPLPGMTTKKPYHTLVGDPDLSWYLGLDPDIKGEDVDQTGEHTQVSTVEVPRWRDKPYSSCYSLEGTENVDDKMYEKRHQKLEAEERRQLRWHMRRIREQRHVEKLRQRQRDPWSHNGTTGFQQPSMYTIWPQPLRDVRFIEITDTLPVMAFGEILPALPPADFVLPWVRTSKALKRSKRSKTLH